MHGERELKWRESGEREKGGQKGSFSASSSKYECYEINERSFFTGCRFSL
jgi:hypothetical protein